jgi:nitrite reductase/ring-hydroxylating ferredoxin subunit
VITLPLKQLPCPGSFEVESTDPARPGAFVVRVEGGVSAYLNTCPHTGAPLNWQPNQFFDLDQQHLFCSLHGALFRPEDGYCIAGPCKGKSLTPLPVTIEDGQVRLEFSP